MATPCAVDNPTPGRMRYDDATGSLILRQGLLTHDLVSHAPDDAGNIVLHNDPAMSGSVDAMRAKTA